MRRSIIALALLSGAAGAAEPDVKIVSFPEIGTETSIPAGGEIYSFTRVYTLPGAQLDADAKAGSWLLEEKIAAGTQLIPVTTKAKFKACVPEAGTLIAKGPCFLDDDGDGKFDRQAADEIEMARKIKPPAPYTMTPVSVARDDNFKRAILFQGATADSLRFSYREFKNDMARPAFTEELTIPREPFPTMILLKDLQIEVLGVSGMGLRYRVIKAS